MKKIDKIRNYIVDDEYKLTILTNKVNICNYDKIDYLDTDKIIIKYNNGNTVINGNNLSVLKLLNQEILVRGNVKNIEMRSNEK